MGKLQGVHHAAFVMWEPEKTVHFYRDLLGFPIIHCITAKGWGQEGHADFVHIFFDAGGGNVIAFFHYFGEAAREQRSKDYIDNGRHTALRASSRAELEAWRDKLKAAGVNVSPLIEHEVIASIYFTDPNGYPLEITANRSDAEVRRYIASGSWVDLTIGEALRRTAARVPDRLAFASEEGRLSFRELDERSDRLAGALLLQGVQPGERAIFQMGTVLETAVALTACFKAGIVPVCTVPQYREIEIGQLAQLSGATLYFVQADFSAFNLVGFAQGMQAKFPSLARLIVARGKGGMDFSQLIETTSLKD